jgi:hydroxyethylthiazole kinase
MTNELASRAADALDAVRARRPLVHNITNYVVMSFSANALLSLGASPVMAHAVEEVEELAAAASALVLNIGTLSAPWIEAMFLAGRAAGARGVPIVLDPVGAGATRLRTDTALRLLDEVRPAVVRGNASEVIALAGAAGATRGVDATRTVEEALASAIATARARRCVVAVTGEVDVVTDGHRIARVANGHPLMGRVTGAGCVATAIVAAFCAVVDDPFVATTVALGAYGVAGELAGRDKPGPGTFPARLVDGLAALDRGRLAASLRLSVGEVDA